MHIDTQNNVRFSRIGILVLCLISIIVITNYLLYAPSVSDAKKKIELELDAISAFPNSTPLGRISGNKLQSAYATKFLYSKASYEDIHTYYDAELTHSGWVSVQEKVNDRPCAACGRITVTYKKDDFTVMLMYRGFIEPTPWSYAIQMSWCVGGCDPE